MGGLYSIGLHNSINVRTFTYACVDFGDDSIHAACQLSSRISKVEVDALYCTSIQYVDGIKQHFVESNP